MKQAPRRPRTVGLDKPCRKCGRPIHHTYVGPVEGLCGRCTDTGRRQRVRTRRIGLSSGGPRTPKRRSATATALLVGLAMLVGAAVLVLALDFLLG